MNSKFWMTFVVRIDLLQYTLGLSRNFNLRLVSPKYLRYIFVSLCSDNSLHLNPRLAIPKLQRARKLPPPVKSRHAKCPWYPWTERTSSNRWGYFRNLPHIPYKRVSKPWFPTAIPSAHPFVHQGREKPRRNPTPCSVRHPAGASSPTTRPQQHLDVAHPPYRMRIRHRSRRCCCRPKVKCLAYPSLQEKNVSGRNRRTNTKCTLTEVESG